MGNVEQQEVNEIGKVSNGGIGNMQRKFECV